MNYEQFLCPVMYTGRNVCISEIRPISETGHVCENYTLCNKICHIWHEVTWWNVLDLSLFLSSVSLLEVLCHLLKWFTS